MPSVNVTGFDNINASLRQIIQAINNLNTEMVDLNTNIEAIETTLATAFPAPLSGSATWDPASLLTLTQASTTITVAGAALGNRVSVAFSLDIQAQTLTAYVSSANTVTIVLFNSTNGTLNLGSGILTVKVYQ